MDQIFDAAFMESVSKLMIALILAGLIGFEREVNKHSAGFRTHILVGVSSCLMMLLSINGFDYFIEHYDNVRFDPARIPSYVISGIGFLGAGTIIVNGGTIRGLTTAASIWAVAGLGLIVGIGMYKEAIVTTLIILISLVVLNKFEQRLHRKNHYIIFEVKLSKNKDTSKFIERVQSFPIEIREFDIYNENTEITKIKMYIDAIHQKKRENLYEWLLEQESVKKIKIRFRS
ncbi:MgtC/SapB family protein [Gracilibacillus caseinilyticus]|uniref:MgtC/SapB family protein n=1 Tax=Gracilibacillus caseinilyticus TaxID=2932256 RepID=A0ABY4EYW6_9BACI|nr:MgtC/SapB family protein [Gracilibacillus caseinilyticus]UOQ49485.1 MgtC/SapB family protein [Gracilibacillus caseinilyticus]